MTAPRDRHPFGWAMAGLALLLLAGLYVMLLTRWPVAAGWVLSLVMASSVSAWVTGRNLRADNEALRKLHDAWNSSEKREDYADLGPVTGPTKTVDQYDQDTDDSQPRWESSVGFRMHVSRGWDEDPFAPDCGCELAPCGLVVARAGCLQHDNGKTIRQAHPTGECPAFQPAGEVELFDGARLAEWREQAEPVVHEPEPDGLFGRVCAYSVHCDAPVAGRVTWDTGKVEWLCAEHYTLVMGTEPCPEAGGCRRPEQCVPGCHWRRLDELNRPLVDEPKVSDQ